MLNNKCTFPDLLKCAEMTALFEKLDRLCKENYRPVSILTALSKVFKKCIAVNLYLILTACFLNIILALEKNIIARAIFFEW